MDVIAEIFAALGEATAIAKALQEPVQTVHSWKANRSIPRWRRAALLDLPPVEGKRLSIAALSYLQSDKRTTHRAPADVAA